MWCIREEKNSDLFHMSAGGWRGRDRACIPQCTSCRHYCWNFALIPYTFSLQIKPLCSLFPLRSCNIRSHGAERLGFRSHGWQHDDDTDVAGTRSCLISSARSLQGLVKRVGCRKPTDTKGSLFLCLFIFNTNSKTAFVWLKFKWISSN